MRGTTSPLQKWVTHTWAVEKVRQKGMSTMGRTLSKHTIERDTDERESPKVWLESKDL